MTAATRLPDFLVVGAMKAGTTSLSGYLSQHPDIHMPPGEVHYFDREEHFAQGEQWYARALTSGLAASVGRDVLLGEKTPTYSYLPECAARIHQCVPEAKLVWIFREPVRRTFSNYLHARKKGTDRRSFDRALAQERSGREGNLFRQYVRRSYYAEQIRRFTEFYPLRSMHFMLFEDLLSDPLAELNRLALFLGVSPFDRAPSSRHDNATRMPFSTTSLYLTDKLIGRNNVIYKAVSGVNRLVPGKVPVLSADLSGQLASDFVVWNRELAELTDLDLGAWERG